jgi:Family of unknown function (DUF5999)
LIKGKVKAWTEAIVALSVGTVCTHQPPCPPADSLEREAARTVACHPEQGWSLLCNGVVVFEDTGELLPDGGVIDPHRPTDRVVAA